MNKREHGSNYTKASQAAATKKARGVEQYAKRAIQNSRKALLLDVCQGMLEAYRDNGNRLPYGHVEVLLKKLVKTMIQYHY